MVTDAMSRVKAWLAKYASGGVELGPYLSDVASLVQELEATRKQLERAEAALKFYADVKNYEIGSMKVKSVDVEAGVVTCERFELGLVGEWTRPIDDDDGKVARDYFAAKDRKASE